MPVNFLGGLPPPNPWIPRAFGHIEMCPKCPRQLSENHAAIVRPKIECLSDNVGIYDQIICDESSWQEYRGIMSFCMSGVSIDFPLPNVPTSVERLKMSFHNNSPGRTIPPRLLSSERELLICHLYKIIS